MFHQAGAVFRLGLLPAELRACAFEVEVILVCGVVFRAEHCAKALAGAFVDHPQELACRRIAAIPVTLEHDPAAIRQNEGRHVDRLGAGMG